MRPRTKFAIAGAVLAVTGLLGSAWVANRAPRYGAGLVRMGGGPPELVVYQKPDRRGLDELGTYLTRLRGYRRARVIVAREDDASGLIVRRRPQGTVMSFQIGPRDVARERRIAAFFRDRGITGQPEPYVLPEPNARPSDWDYPLPDAPERQRALVAATLGALFGVTAENTLSYDFEGLD